MVEATTVVVVVAAITIITIITAVGLLPLLLPMATTMSRCGIMILAITVVAAVVDEA